MLSRYVDHIYMYRFYVTQEIIEYWLRKGVDGFRVDAVPHLFETNYTSDEPESKAPGVTGDDYAYLNHTLTKDQPRTYELVQSWRKILDDYANRTNTDEKVALVFPSTASRTRNNLRNIKLSSARSRRRPLNVASLH